MHEDVKLYNSIELRKVNGKLQRKRVRSDAKFNERK